MSRRAPVPDRVQEAYPRILKLCRDVARRHGADADELVNVAYEEAKAFEPKFRPGEASFATAVFKHVYGAVHDYVRSDRRDHRLRCDLAEIACRAAKTAGDNEDGSKPNLFHESDAQIRERFGVATQRMMGSMYLGLMATAPDPESEYLLAEERALMRIALNEVFDDFDGEDRAIVERYFRDGEDLKAVLASLPGWSSKAYTTGWRYVNGKLRDELFEAFWVRGIGPKTARELVGRLSG